MKLPIAFAFATAALAGCPREQTPAHDAAPAAEQAAAPTPSPASTALPSPATVAPPQDTPKPPQGRHMRAPPPEPDPLLPPPPPPPVTH